MEQKIKKIALLTGGGDCPGLNAVIRAVTRTAIKKKDSRGTPSFCLV